MKFYTQQHKFYCGIDLHTKNMFVCILDAEGNVRVLQNIHTNPEAFLRIIAPFREDIVVTVECMFTWYWIADLCMEQKIPFVLGHALYMKAIHGGKAKNDKIDSHKIATLLRGGILPQAYVYPARMRSTRDLLRRRNHLMRKRAELFAHIQNTRSQYNLPDPLGCIAKLKNREGIVQRFDDPSVQKSLAVDLEVIEAYDHILTQLERDSMACAKEHDPTSYALLQTIPGVGRILGLVFLYEIESIDRFPSVQDFVSYCRLVKCIKESKSKKYGSSGKKIGNTHLKWAFSETAVLFLKGNEPCKKYPQRLTRKHGKAKALSILAHKLRRTVYFMLNHKEAFNPKKFLGL